MLKKKNLYYPSVRFEDINKNLLNYLSFFLIISRGCRFVRKVLAINFVTDDDRRTLIDIQQFYNTEIHDMPINIVDLI